MLRKAYKIFGKSPGGTPISVLIKGKDKVFYKKKGITKAKSKAGFCCFDTLLNAENFLLNNNVPHLRSQLPISLVEIEEGEKPTYIRWLIEGKLTDIEVLIRDSFPKGTIFAKSLRIVSLTYAEYEEYL